ncbi:efflux RND transporter periplasmic adaptor subunit [Alsobacter soli]|uniref:Efflux RND transporter periplasmic adaptor subunit n=1 Tax=Alsobacter soli TaxID=2109933 RepID=A0A2T1HUV2_9HYPH|nr:efflux RND transporter periplasmic adaptor subunit [Alsobacter soli]PSC05427.1 efflux RND transporter periplasmic adaptor subunit [Alsobacter soli]
MRSRAAISALAMTASLLAFGSVAVAQSPAPSPKGQSGAAPRAAPVLLGKAERRPIPVRFDTIGSVQPMATVTLRSRVESQIMAAPFQDGAKVRKGDLLFQLDARQIEAQLKQAEANLARSKAQLEQAQRDVRRAEQLAANEYASRQKLDDSRTAVLTIGAQIQADEAAIENLKVQLSYYTLRAPIDGRVGVAGLRPGNIAKTGDGSVALATINQLSPIYISFAMPQRLLPDLRQAMTAGGGTVTATPQGLKSGVDGKIAVFDNTVDGATGTITIRAIFENADELLWPGQLCNVRVTLRVEDNAVAVPREAVQTSQTGSFVFTVADGVARVRPVKVSRLVDGWAVIESGLDGSEIVVTDGQLLLTDGVKVEPRDGKAPASGGSAGAMPSDAGKGA